MKRTRDNITGGTGDFNPQWLRFSTVQGFVNADAKAAIPIPINRVGTNKNKATVIEILKVQWRLPNVDTNHAAGGNTLLVAATLATNTGPAGDNFDSAAVIDEANFTWRGAFSAGGSFQNFVDNIVLHDITDGAGHGVLVGTDQIYLNLTTQNFNAVQSVYCSILYRFKEVTLPDYIGIVQSQS